MPIDLTKLHEQTCGYTMRTGKRGSYKYWYRDSATGKLYTGKKPPTFLIDQFPKEQNDPPACDIIENPWENYNSTNLQMIHTRETNVPFNKLGLTTRFELEQYESYLLSINYRRIFENLKTFPEYYLPVNSAKIKLLHRRVFGDLYEWAGEYRNINVSKEGFPFPPPDRISEEMHKIDIKYFNRINYNKNASIEDVSELISIISSEITLIHPFREGNGRIVRLITDIILIAFNHKPANWGILEQPEDKQKYLECIFEGYRRNYKPLAGFIRALV